MKKEASVSLSHTQLAVLEHLAAVAVQQKADARATRKKFRGGWTHLKYGKHVKLRTVQRLLELGHAMACCTSHPGADTVRITRKGVALLEGLRGEEILA